MDDNDRQLAVSIFLILKSSTHTGPKGKWFETEPAQHALANEIVMKLKDQRWTFERGPRPRGHSIP